jgi:hypothetical protein
LELYRPKKGNQQKITGGNQLQIRKVLREAAYPRSNSEPKHYRASCLGKWFWCAEQSRHLALGLIPEEVVEPAEIGTMGHKVLEETIGRRFPWETQFFDELAKYQDSQLGFVRGIENSKVYCNLTGHQDDLQITPDRTVCVVENKFVQNTKFWYIQRWKLPMAQFQTQIYCWILDPIVKELGGIMNRSHAVCFWDLTTFQHLFDFKVDYLPAQTEENILRCIHAYEDPNLIIPAKPWKCTYCPEVHKRLCQYEAKNKSAN